MINVVDKFGRTIQRGCFIVYATSNNSSANLTVALVDSVSLKVNKYKYMVDREEAKINVYAVEELLDWNDELGNRLTTPTSKVFLRDRLTSFRSPVNCIVVEPSQLPQKYLDVLSEIKL